MKNYHLIVTILFVLFAYMCQVKAQYWHPQSSQKPALFWSCKEVVPIGNINALGETDKTKGLQYHLLAQSVAGLANRAVEKGENSVGVWLHDHSGKISYEVSKQALIDMGIAEIGAQTAVELTTRNYGAKDGISLRIKDIFDGYVLTDVENNPESNIVASVASHVYNSIIVDVRDKEYYESNGYTMTYDASQKSTQDAWLEFKDKCNNKALVVMPVQTGQLREFAIKNNLFVINLNKQYATTQGGQNIALFEEVLQWLEPNSPVYGWEQGVGEDQFVERISQTGNIMIPADWSYNTTLTSLDYQQRQPGLVKTIDPKNINWNETGKKYVSFYLSDGDNIQWMMNDFSNANYYAHPATEDVKMAFGLPVDNLSMIAPSMCQHLFNEQLNTSSIVQTFGGGYNYIDNYGEDKLRPSMLKSLAEATAIHMRRHGVKVLALMAKDVKSASSKEAYQAYINANDQLDGIISVQYSPYAGGGGDIMWFTNAKGYDIPVITVKYSIWDFGGYNNPKEGTPDYIADILSSSSDTKSFNLVMVHAWSGFNADGNAGGNIKGPGAARLCADKLDDSFKVVNLEEMIWRLRMHYRSSQTKSILNIPNTTTHITTVGDLQAMSSNPSGNYILDNDIDMKGESWSSFDFTGKLNGAGYSIHNLSIRHDGDRGGLFNNITGATISNLGLEDIMVDTPNAWTAAFAGDGSNSSITKCFVTGTITSNGFAGSFIGHVDNSIVSECYSTATVTGRDHVGGIVAHINGNGATIENCYFDGDVYSTGWQVGGIAGWAEGGAKISKCYVRGTTGSESGFSGGILGVAPGGQNVTVSECIGLQGSITTVNPDIEKTYRIVGDHAGAIFTNNFGYDRMKLTDPHKSFWDSEADGKDGADISEQQFKDATFYSDNLGWDFSQVWKMGTDGPVLSWEKSVSTDVVNAEASSIQVFVVDGQIHVKGTDAQSLIAIYDMAGRLLEYKHDKSSESVFNTKGILIVKVSSGTESISKKVINY